MIATRPHASHRIALVAVLLVALAARLAVAWASDPLAPYDRAAGSDQWWYLEYSYRQVKDEAMEPLSSAPLYLLLLGSVRYALEPERTDKADKHMIYPAPGGGLAVKSVAGAPSIATVRIAWTVQALLGTATVYFVYRLGRVLGGDVRAGLVAGGLLAVSVAAVMTTAQILTETTYLFFLTAAVMVYAEWAAGARAYRHPVLAGVLVGGLFGLATLTRAALLLFPLGVAAHALLVMVMDRRRGLRSPLTRRALGALLAVYIAVNGIWTTYYYLRWGEVVIGAKGLSAFLYLGGAGGWQGPEQTDAALGAVEANPVSDDDFNAGTGAVVRADPAAYLMTRAQDLLGAYAQPYGTVAFPGRSIRVLAADWWQAGRSAAGLVVLLQTEGFTPKLLIYMAHYGGIALGAVGVVVTARRWRVSLVLVGFIAYVTLLHLALLALPRYLFPTLPFWWVFAGVALVWAWDRLPLSRRL